MICAQCHIEKTVDQFRKRGTLCCDCYSGNEMSAKKRWQSAHGAEACRKWRKLHPELDKERNKLYKRRSYLKNRDSILARQTAKRAANPEKHRAATRRWIAEHKEEYAIMNRANQHARRVKFGQYQPTKAAIVKLLGEWDGKCKYCAKEITQYHIDHILPVSKGGSGDITNLAVVCKECNWSKRDKTLLEWKNSKDIIVLYKSSLIDSKVRRDNEAEGVSHRERLNEKTQQWDAIVRSCDINETQEELRNVVPAAQVSPDQSGSNNMDYGNLMGFAGGSIYGDRRADYALSQDSGVDSTVVNQSSAILYTHSTAATIPTTWS